MADVKSFQEQVNSGDLNGVRPALPEAPALPDVVVSALLEELGAKLR